MPYLLMWHSTSGLSQMLKCSVGFLWTSVSLQSVTYSSWPFWLWIIYTHFIFGHQQPLIIWTVMCAFFLLPGKADGPVCAPWSDFSVQCNNIRNFECVDCWEAQCHSAFFLFCQVQIVFSLFMLLFYLFIYLFICISWNLFAWNYYSCANL